MNLTPEQTQMLQYYMQKNRNIPQAAQAPSVQLPGQTAGGTGGASFLSALGGMFDTPATQGPVQPGEEPLPGMQQSWLSKFADRLDPAAAQQRQLLEQQQSAPKIDMKQILSALAKAGMM
jgi:hypothetical protein